MSDTLLSTTNPHAAGAELSNELCSWQRFSNVNGTVDIDIPRALWRGRQPGVLLLLIEAAATTSLTHNRIAFSRRGVNRVPLSSRETLDPVPDFALPVLSSDLGKNSLLEPKDGVGVAVLTSAPETSLPVGKLHSPPSPGGPPPPGEEESSRSAMQLSRTPVRNRATCSEPGALLAVGGLGTQGVVGTSAGKRSGPEVNVAPSSCPSPCSRASRSLLPASTGARGARPRPTLSAAHPRQCRPPLPGTEFSHSRRNTFHSATAPVTIAILCSVSRCCSTSSLRCHTPPSSRDRAAACADPIIGDGRPCRGEPAGIRGIVLHGLDGTTEDTGRHRGGGESPGGRWC
eukprot:RCo014700